jgi:hypothetical protein
MILFLLFTDDVTICMELDPGIHIGNTWFVLKTGCDNHHGNHYEGTNPLYLEEDQNHERSTVDRPTSPTQSYDSSHSCIEHEGENA